MYVAIGVDTLPLWRVCTEAEKRKKCRDELEHALTVLLLQLAPRRFVSCLIVTPALPLCV